MSQIVQAQGSASPGKQRKKDSLSFSNLARSILTITSAITVMAFLASQIAEGRLTTAIISTAVVGGAIMGFAVALHLFKTKAH